MSIETPETPNGAAANDTVPRMGEERMRETRALSDAERNRRLAQAMDQLSLAIVTSTGVDELLFKSLEILLEIASVDVGVVRLREGDRLVSRSAVGLEEEVAAGFSLPIDEAFPAAGRGERTLPVLSVAPADASCRSEFMGKKSVRAVYSLPLLDADELVGVVYLGTRCDRDFSEEEKELLSTVTGRTAAAVVRQAKHDSLEQAVRSREDVLGIVAHDLRNPISVISIAANTLLRRLPDSSARRSVERIVRGTQRADRLVQGLLEIDAIEGGRFSVETAPVETAEPILAAIESQQSLAAGANIIIASDLSPELPPIEADAERILEVLENLIGNAIKFNTPGGSVTVGASAREHEVLFWVKDTGSGVSPEALPHLFDRFWQAKKQDRRGSGLGLSICKAIIEAHGGRIWPESKAGRGTSMFFTVPAVKRDSTSTKVKVANILLVDDRPENLLSLKAILDRPEYHLVTAQSGEEALSLALRETFSVALLDIAMPGMNGLEVAVHLKDLERSRDIAIIFVTAFGHDPQEIHRAYSAGGADYLIKPLDPEIVRKKVAVFVDLGRRRETNGRPGNGKVSIK